MCMHDILSSMQHTPFLLSIHSLYVLDLERELTMSYDASARGGAKRNFRFEKTDTPMHRIVSDKAIGLNKSRVSQLCSVFCLILSYWKSDSTTSLKVVVGVLKTGLKFFFFSVMGHKSQYNWDK